MNIIATAYCALQYQTIACQLMPNNWKDLLWHIVVMLLLRSFYKTINNSVFFYCSHSISSLDLDRIAYPAFRLNTFRIIACNLEVFRLFKRIWLKYRYTNVKIFIFIWSTPTVETCTPKFNISISERCTVFSLKRFHESGTKHEEAIIE